MESLEQLKIDEGYEKIAHKYAYKNDLSEFEDNSIEFYGLSPHIRHSSFTDGFSMTVFNPLFSNNNYLNTVIAFRGTNDPMDVYADLDNSNNASPGIIQFRKNKDLIKRVINDANTNKVILTGHSLGGAIAQLAATVAPEKVKEIITFQAPGVNGVINKVIKQYNNGRKQNDQVISRHYRASECIVDNAGATHTPGDIFIINTERVKHVGDWLVPEELTSPIGRAILAHTLFILEEYFKEGNTNTVITWSKRKTYNCFSFRIIELLRREVLPFVKKFAGKMKEKTAIFQGIIEAESIIVETILNNQIGLRDIDFNVRLILIELLIYLRLNFLRAEDSERAIELLVRSTEASNLLKLKAKFASGIFYRSGEFLTIANMANIIDSMLDNN